MNFPNANCDSTTCSQETEFELGITRKRNLKPDNKGRYRPRVGHLLFVFDSNGIPRELREKRERRFNLGTNKKVAEIRYARIQKLYEENCEVNGCNAWSPLALSYAELIAKGNSTIQFPPLTDEYADPILEYAQMLEVNRTMFPSLQFEPLDKELFQVSRKLNEELKENTLTELENELRELGVISKQGQVPRTLVSGSFHEALEGYDKYIHKTGLRCSADKLKLSQRKRLQRVKRFKKLHKNFPLHQLSRDKCEEILIAWKNRPKTKKGSSSSKSDVRHHVGELFRFWRWLDLCEEFAWFMPRGVEALNRKIPKTESEKTVSPVSKKVYSPKELGVLNQHATPLERLMLYLGINCAMGAAEQGRLTADHFLKLQAHELAKPLFFDSTNDDSFIRMLRPKTDVFCEWFLWPETVEMMIWAVNRAKKAKGDRLLVWETGEPIYSENADNPQAGFANTWNRLLDRVEKSHPKFKRLPFGTLRDTLPNALRFTHSDTLASICLAHGSPNKADNLLECYANKPFGKLHNAIRELREMYEPMFSKVTDPFDGQKSYLPIAVKQRILTMLQLEHSVSEIAQTCQVSLATVHRAKKQMANEPK